MTAGGEFFRKPRDLERAGALCLAFANTEVPRPDKRFAETREAPARRFVDYAELLDWSSQMGILVAAESELLGREAAERPEEAAAVAAGGRELRTASMRVFTAVAFGRELAARDLGVLNGALRRQRVVPGGDVRDNRLVYGGDALALDRMLATIAQSGADLLASPERLERLRQCAAKDCRRLFLHRSSRRLWCDMNLCGNRLKSARYQRSRGKR